MLGFTIGLRGLLSSQAAMDVIGQNIANFATDGYTRKSAILTSTAITDFGRFGGSGTGVRVQDVRRIQDLFLNGRLREEQQIAGASQYRAVTLGMVGGVFAQGVGSSLSVSMQTMFSGFSELTGNPTDAALRGSAVGSASSMATDFRRLARQAGGLEDDAKDELKIRVSELNSLATSIASLNKRILTGSGTRVSSELLDEQDRLLGQLSNLTDFDVSRTERGTVDVLLDGRALVMGDEAVEVQVVLEQDEATLRFTKSKVPIAPKSGMLGSLIEFANGGLNEYSQRLDDVAANMILEFNRLNSTGVPQSGPYTSLVSEVSLGELYPGRDPRNIRLLDLETPFAVRDGILTVNVIDEETGSVRQERLSIDPKRDTVGDLVDRLAEIDGLAASLDASGRLRIDAASGLGFDFSSRIDADPDDAGTFGSAQAVLSGGSGTFALNDGDSLSISVDGAAAQTVTFSSADFASISRATPEEVAAVINAQLGGGEAEVVDGRLVLRSSASGPSSSLLVADQNGASRDVLGLSGVLETGSTQAATLSLEGDPERFGKYTLVPLGEGQVGVTPGLQINVLDEAGNSLGTVDVGEGYAPGDPIEVLPGLNLRIEAGELSQEAGDFVNFELVENGDTSDTLVAFGLATLFTGSDASDITLVSRIEDDRRQLAGSLRGEDGEGDNFFRMLELENRPLDALNGLSLQGSYAALVGEIGFAQSAAQREAEGQELIVNALERQRQEVSGVNLDEEMIRLVEMQQLQAASIRFLQAVQESTNILFELV